jgi:hypothetical protein
MSYDERDRFWEKPHLIERPAFVSPLLATHPDLADLERPNGVAKDVKKGGDKKTNGDKPSPTERSGGSARNFSSRIALPARAQTLITASNRRP